MSPVSHQVAEVGRAGADGGGGSSPQLPGPAPLHHTGAATLPRHQGHLLPPAPRHQAGPGARRAAHHPLGLRTELLARSLGGVVVAGVTLETFGDTHHGHQEQELRSHGNMSVRDEAHHHYRHSVHLRLY